MLSTLLLAIPLWAALYAAKLAQIAKLLKAPDHVDSAASNRRVYHMALYPGGRDKPPFA
jgi:hypothetical protein